MTKKTIAIFTGTRAEFGILKPLIRAVEAHPSVTLNLAVGGTHLSARHGHTIQEIIDAGFAIDAKLDFLIEHNGETQLPNTIAKSIEVSAEYLKSRKPDITVILGDRFEALGFALACYSLGIPIAHIHGGEITAGALDDGFRHSLTKLSSLHFAASATYRNRIIQLGEHPSSVFNTGPLSADNIFQSLSHTKESLFAYYNIPFIPKHVAFLALHPETLLSSEDNSLLVHNTLTALDRFEDIFLFISAANNDPDGGMMNSVLQDYKDKNNDKVFMKSSFGQEMFYNCLWHSDFIIGNSSSAIIEAPMLQIPSINIGKRQDGRDFSDTIFSVEPEVEQIRGIITHLLNKTLKSNDKVLKKRRENVAEKILVELLNFENATPKKFYDVEMVR